MPTASGSQAWANVVWFVHVCVVAFFVLVPWIGNELLLTLWLIAAPSMVLHWLVRSDVCCLTLLEAHLRGVPYERSFVGDLIRPVYSLSNPQALALGYAVLGIGLIEVIRRLNGEFQFGLLRHTWGVVASAVSPRNPPT